MQHSFEQQLAGRYATLSAKLKEAADFVVANPVDVATRSLRAVSKDAKLSPATFSRMSTALGYDGYDALREVLRRSMERHAGSFSSRVEDLQKRHDHGDQSFLNSHLLACSTNLEAMGTHLDIPTIEMCVDRLHIARRVLVAGALGSTGIAEYLTYMASFIADNWSMAHRMGASMASGLVGISDKDVLVVITKPPFAKLTINAAKEASASGAFVIVITDTHTCPALIFASASFIVPTQSPHFFSSYASTLVLVEIMIGMLAGRGGTEARDRIALVEDRNRTLNEVWDR
ncbi:MurR/RpiR family transcriptional regulator [Litoreibacter arenae]|uniref:Putative transcriptional regulator protein n=1 Tax=Litoreibacter arenae DSM 19593 TaxID=1123360 RepID=S9RUE4_9RHOB|nr:MurR/RpiR family transcriptional regulator [Litoreibacter arenae]EPX81640.1 putative transcriptional regulator protein [Litoreibacter arenae DSM 19593]